VTSGSVKPAIFPLFSSIMKNFRKEILAESTVDDFVLRKSSLSRDRNSFQRGARNRFNINHLRTSNFNRFQQGFESGSGPAALSSHDGHRRLIRKLSPSTEKGVISAVSQIKAEITS
jgi:hypothetical protein